MLVGQAVVLGAVSVGVCRSGGRTWSSGSMSSVVISRLSGGRAYSAVDSAELITKLARPPDLGDTPFLANGTTELIADLLGRVHRRIRTTTRQTRSPLI